MKFLFSILVFFFVSVTVFAQESPTENTQTGVRKYFISTNSGLQKTPVGLRIGILEKMGGYIGVRFGKGYKYKDDPFKGWGSSEATLFSASAGFIFSIFTHQSFKIHPFVGLGYGQWFDRPSQNGQTVGFELEGGLMLSYRRFVILGGGNLLMGDGNPVKKDVTVGVGYKF